MPHPPGRTLVVGGTAEGLEYAGFLFGLGLAVAVMPQPDLLPGFDRRMAQKVENDLVVRGLDILRHCSVAEVPRNRRRFWMEASMEVYMWHSNGSFPLSVVD